jgi:hypothetical protein
MNARSHARQAAADNGDVAPGYRSLLLVRACLLNDLDPFVSSARRILLPKQVTSILGNTRHPPAPVGYLSEPRWLAFLFGV